MSMCACLPSVQDGSGNEFRSAHGGIRYGALRSQRSHSNAYAVLSPLAATLLMAQTQSIIVTCTGFHAFGTRSRVKAAVNEIQHCDVTSFRLKIA